MDDLGFVRMGEAARVLGVSRGTLWRWSRSDPAFPKKRIIGPNSTGFLARELRDWIESRPVFGAAEGQGPGSNLRGEGNGGGGDAGSDEG